MNPEEEGYFSHIENLWKVMEPELKKKATSIATKMKNSDAKTSFQTSFTAFSQTITVVRESIETKNPAIFSQHIKDLHDQFKNFLRAFKDENEITSMADLPLIKHKTFFYSMVNLRLFGKNFPRAYSKFSTNIDTESIYSSGGSINISISDERNRSRGLYGELKRSLESIGMFCDELQLFPSILVTIQNLRDSEEHLGTSTQYKPYDPFSRQKAFESVTNFAETP